MSSLGMGGGCCRVGGELGSCGKKVGICGVVDVWKSIKMEVSRGPLLL